MVSVLLQFKNNSALQMVSVVLWNKTIFLYNAYVYNTFAIYTFFNTINAFLCPWEYFLQCLARHVLLKTCLGQDS